MREEKFGKTLYFSGKLWYNSADFRNRSGVRHDAPRKKEVFPIMSEQHTPGTEPRTRKTVRDADSRQHTFPWNLRIPYADKLKSVPRPRMFQAFLLAVAALIVVLIAAVASDADVVTPEPGVTSEMLREQLEYVKDLVTVEYHYTDAEKQEIPGKKLFNFIPMPWTKKIFIISYDGVIKYGVDVSQVGLSVNGIAKVVTVEIPRAKIISHEIPEEGFRVLYESSGPFNRIKIDDVTLFRMTQKDKMETKAEEQEMPQKAQEQSGEAITALLRAVPGMEEYTLDVEYAK